MRHARAIPLLILVAALVAGCLGRSPTTRFYSLRATEGVTEASAGAQSLAIGVGPATMPRYLDRPQIVRRAGESGIEYDEFNRWAGSLDTELLRVLGANLGAMLGTQRVVVYPDLAPYPLAYRILVSVERFEAGPAEEVTLNARWTIRRGDAGEAVAVGRTDVEQPTGSDDTDDLVAAHSAAVAALSRDIATRIDALRGR